MDDRLLVTAGAVRVAANRVSANLILNVAANLYDSKTMPFSEALSKPVKHLSIYASRSVNAVPTIANNRSLWQEGQQNEFGAKVSVLDDRLIFAVVGFQISQTNVAVPISAFNTDTTVPSLLISDINERGCEFEFVGGTDEESFRCRRHHLPSSAGFARAAGSSDRWPECGIAVELSFQRRRVAWTEFVCGGDLRRAALGRSTDA